MVRSSPDRSALAAPAFPGVGLIEIDDRGLRSVLAVVRVSSDRWPVVVQALRRGGRSRWSRPLMSPRMRAAISLVGEGTTPAPRRHRDEGRHRDEEGAESTGRWHVSGMDRGVGHAPYSSPGPAGTACRGDDARPRLGVPRRNDTTQLALTSPSRMSMSRSRSNFCAVHSSSAVAVVAAGWSRQVQPFRYDLRPLCHPEHVPRAGHP